MIDAKDRKRTLGTKALEAVMRDVLDGMEELALLKAFQPGAEVVEIIAIEPPTRPESEALPAPRVSRVVPFARCRRRDTG